MAVICDIQKMLDEMDELLLDGVDIAENEDTDTFIEWAEYYAGIDDRRDSLIKHSMPPWFRVTEDRFLLATHEERILARDIHRVFKGQWSEQFTCCIHCEAIKFERRRLESVRN